MANTFTQARKDIKLLASFVRGLSALDEVLDEASSLDKVILDKKAELGRLEGELDKRGEMLGKARAEADLLVEKAKCTADEMLEAANEGSRKASVDVVEANKAVSAAKVEAERIINEADAKGKARIENLAGAESEASKRVAAAEARLEEILIACDRAEARYKKAVDDLADLRASLK